MQVWQRIYGFWGLEDLAEKLGIRYAEEGQTAYWRTLLETPPPFEPDDFYKAYLYAGMGDKDRAFELLDRAMDQKLNGTSFFGLYPSTDVFSGDPRFEQAITRLNRPPIPAN